MAKGALKTTIAAESGFLIAAMPTSPFVSMASLLVVAGWVTFKVMGHLGYFGAVNA
jgi:hypothetical protein